MPVNTLIQGTRLASPPPPPITSTLRKGSQTYGSCVSCVVKKLTDLMVATTMIKHTETGQINEMMASAPYLSSRSFSCISYSCERDLGEGACRQAAGATVKVVGSVAFVRVSR